MRVCSAEQARALLIELHEAYNSMPAFKRDIIRSALTTISICREVNEVIAETRAFKGGASTTCAST